MSYLIILIVLSIFHLYLSLSTIYYCLIALAFFLVRDNSNGDLDALYNFAIIVPAHNEELLIGNLCQSLMQVDYPKDMYNIFIVADNCNDNTVEVCRQYQVDILERHDLVSRGKGQALDWALRKIDLSKFDAVFIVDADNFVDVNILKALSGQLNNGENAIQCYNAVGNRNDSWFTQLLYVSRVINNNLYHESKCKLGLTSYLMGNGLCFSASLIQDRGWTAFSAGEDWEYYAQLVEDDIKISFAANAKVFHQESRSLNQATSQRLRWSSGRFTVARTLGLRLIKKGVRERNWKTVDASLPLILPNYSLLVSLTLLALLLSFFFLSFGVRDFFLISFFVLLGAQFLLFLTGTFLAGSPLSVFRAALYIPVFLVWKSVVDVLCLTGIYRGGEWIRTMRHKPEPPPED